MDLFNAITNKDVTTSKAILKDPKLNLDNINYLMESPLTLCCDRAEDDAFMIDIIRQMLQHPKCNVNTKDKCGNTGLHIICNKLISLDALKLFLNQGDIDLGVFDSDGLTAINRLIHNLNGSNFGTTRLFFRGVS